MYFWASAGAIAPLCPSGYAYERDQSINQSITKALVAELLQG